MDKVIIDGVDVSGCEFIGDIKNKFVKCTSWVHNSKKQVSGHWDCRENKACYYKQLQRLQAKYDDLHLTYAGCKTANNGLQELNQKLQAENERLKSALAIWENATLKQTALKVVEVDKYRQALQEIRDKILSPEIIDEETKKLHTSEELDNIVRWHREDKLSKIKAKINEVIGAEE